METNRNLDIDNYTGNYGPFGDAYGVIVDLVGKAEAHGAIAPNGRWIGFPGKGPARRILCGDIIATMTEDGPSDGRCGAPVRHIEDGACPGHAEERNAWLSMSETDRWAWEMANERA